MAEEKMCEDCGNGILQAWDALPLSVGDMDAVRVHENCLRMGGCAERIRRNRAAKQQQEGPRDAEGNVLRVGDWVRHNASRTGKIFAFQDPKKNGGNDLIVDWQKEPGWNAERLHCWASNCLRLTPQPGGGSGDAPFEGVGPLRPPLSEHRYQTPYELFAAAVQDNLVPLLPVGFRVVTDQSHKSGTLLHLWVHDDEGRQVYKANYYDTKFDSYDWSLIKNQALLGWAKLLATSRAGSASAK